MEVSKILAEYDAMLAAGRRREAGEFLSEAADAAAREDDAVSEASLRGELTGYWRVFGEPEKSFASAERALAPALEAFLTLSGGRDIHRPNAFAAAGQLRMLQGRYAEAAVCYREAARSLADKVGASENVERLRAAGSRAARLAGWEAGAS